jgi:diphthine-ammonia ligase
MKVGCSWSGGKDSCFALMQAAAQGHTPVVLVNMMNENGAISRSHALTEGILQQQAAAIGLPIINKPASWQQYESVFIETLQQVKLNYDVAAMVFGDIDLQPHRDWEEKVCATTGLQALLPIWQLDRKNSVMQMLNAGIKTIITACNSTMGETFLGRILDEPLVQQLEEIGVDVCGENGEFHTVVIEAPLFKKSIQLPLFTKVKQRDYYFLKWL